MDRADEVLDDMGIDGFSDVADQGRHSELLKLEHFSINFKLMTNMTIALLNAQICLQNSLIKYYLILGIV